MPTLPTIAVLSFLLGCILAPALQAADAPAEASKAEAKTVTIKVEPQSWQVRRGEFARIVNNLSSKDPQVVAAFDAVLTEFEQKPFSRTPMENMEILGVYYVPREGIEPTLTFIAANAALGWYDALRYGSASGRQEILHNEGFFKLPMVLAGNEYIQQAVKFFVEQPEKTAQLVQKGIAIADALKDDPRYDHQWPSAYGLERTLCAMGADCAKPTPVQVAEWADAWEETKASVTRYYRNNDQQATAPTGQTTKASTSETKKTVTPKKKR
jgi:hypothetical protein